MAPNTISNVDEFNNIVSFHGTLKVFEAERH